MKNRNFVYTLFGWLGLAGYLAQIAAPICWLWSGWSVAWRVSVSGIVLNVGLLFIKTYIQFLIKSSDYERQTRESDQKAGL